MRVCESASACERSTLIARSGTSTDRLPRWPNSMEAPGPNGFPMGPRERRVVYLALAGILILAGGISAGSVQRGQRVALLKTLGMTRQEVAAMMATEYALIGVVAGIIGTAGGALLSWFVLTRSMELSWQPYPRLILTSLVLSVVLTALTGIVASWGALQRPPLAVLRAD